MVAVSIDTLAGRGGSELGAVFMCGVARLDGGGWTHCSGRIPSAGVAVSPYLR